MDYRKRIHKAFTRERLADYALFGSTFGLSFWVLLKLQQVMEEGSISVF